MSEKARSFGTCFPGDEPLQTFLDTRLRNVSDFSFVARSRDAWTITETELRLIAGPSITERLPRPLQTYFLRDERVRQCRSMTGNPTAGSRARVEGSETTVKLVPLLLVTVAAPTVRT
jgi:hypothetical protein